MDNSHPQNGFESQANEQAGLLLKMLSQYEGNHIITKDVRDKLVAFFQSPRKRGFVTATRLSFLVFRALTGDKKKKCTMHDLYHGYDGSEFGFRHRGEFFSAIRALNKIWGQIVSVRCEVYGRKTNPATITLSLLF